MNFEKALFSTLCQITHQKKMSKTSIFRIKSCFSSQYTRENSLWGASKQLGKQFYYRDLARLHTKKKCPTRSIFESNVAFHPNTRGKNHFGRTPNSWEISSISGLCQITHQKKMSQTSKFRSKSWFSSEYTREKSLWEVNCRTSPAGSSVFEGRAHIKMIAK